MLGTAQILIPIGAPTAKAALTGPEAKVFVASTFEAAFAVSPELTSPTRERALLAEPAPPNLDGEPTLHDLLPSAAHHRHVATLTFDVTLAPPPSIADLAGSSNPMEVQDKVLPNKPRRLADDIASPDPIVSCVLRPIIGFASDPLVWQTVPSEISCSIGSEASNAPELQDLPVHALLLVDPHQVARPVARDAADEAPVFRPSLFRHEITVVGSADPPLSPLALTVDQPNSAVSTPPDQHVAGSVAEAAISRSEPDRMHGRGPNLVGAALPPIAANPAPLLTRVRPIAPPPNHPDLAERQKSDPVAKPLLPKTSVTLPEPTQAERGAVSKLPTKAEVSQPPIGFTGIARSSASAESPVQVSKKAVQSSQPDVAVKPANAKVALQPALIPQVYVDAAVPQKIQNQPDGSTTSPIWLSRNATAGEPVPTQFDRTRTSKIVPLEGVPAKAIPEPVAVRPMVRQATVQPTDPKLEAGQLSRAPEVEITPSILKAPARPEPLHGCIKSSVELLKDAPMPPTSTETLFLAAAPDQKLVRLTLHPSTTSRRADTPVTPGRRMTPDLFHPSGPTPEQALLQFRTMLERVPSNVLPVAASLALPPVASGPSATSPVMSLPTQLTPRQETLSAPILIRPAQTAEKALSAQGTGSSPLSRPYPTGLDRVLNGIVPLQLITAQPDFTEVQSAERTATNPDAARPKSGRSDAASPEQAKQGGARQEAGSSIAIDFGSPKSLASGSLEFRLAPRLPPAPSSTRTVTPEALTVPTNKPLEQPHTASSRRAEQSHVGSTGPTSNSTAVPPAEGNVEALAVSLPIRPVREPLQIDFPVPEVTQDQCDPTPVLARPDSQVLVGKSSGKVAMVASPSAPIGLAQLRNSHAFDVPQAANKGHVRVVPSAPSQRDRPDAEALFADPFFPQLSDLVAGLHTVARSPTRVPPSGQLQPVRTAEISVAAPMAADRTSRTLSRGFSTNLARTIGETGHCRAELILDPAELGRLRFNIVTHDDKVQINLAVERPETLTLLRNHADDLRQEFRAAGFTDSTLNFSQWGRQDEGKSLPELAQSFIRPEDLMPVLADTTAPRPRTASDGLDLRL